MKYINRVVPKVIVMTLIAALPLAPAAAHPRGFHEHHEFGCWGLGCAIVGAVVGLVTLPFAIVAAATDYDDDRRDGPQYDAPAYPPPDGYAEPGYYGAPPPAYYYAPPARYYAPRSYYAPPGRYYRAPSSGYSSERYVTSPYSPGRNYRAERYPPYRGNQDYRR